MLRQPLFRLVALITFVVLFFNRLLTTAAGIPSVGNGELSKPVDPLAGLTEGRMVHFVLPDGRSAGEHRPAVVVRVWNKATGYVNLQVLTDGSNDGDLYAAGVYWATSVTYSEGKEPRTWHWIEQAS